MGTTTFYLNYRPVRIGFLVRNGNTEDLIEAASLNTILWGGIFNPIIPVSYENKSTDQLIDLFSVDALYAVAESDPIKEVLKRHDFLRCPHNFENVIYSLEGDKAHTRYVDIINLILVIWDKEFKFAPQDYKSNCTFIRWDNEDAFSTLYTLLFGSYKMPFEGFASHFIKGLKAKELAISKGDNIEASLTKTVSPIDFTRERLMSYRDSISEGGIYVGDEKNFDDLLNFWNIRAAGDTIIFFPVNNNSRWHNYASEFLKRIDERPDRYPNAPDMISFYCKGDETRVYEEVKKIMSMFATRKDKVISPCDGLNVWPSEVRYDSKSVLANVDEKFNRPAISFSFPEKTFIDYEDVDMRYQLLALSINPLSGYDYSGYTLNPPYIRSLNEYYSREIATDPFALRVEKGGISIIINAKDESTTLYPLSHDRLIKKIFEYSDVKASLSQPGLLAQRIIEKLGGLGSMNPFRIRGVRELVDSLRSTDTITRGDAGKLIYGDGSFKKYEHMYLEKRDKALLDPQDVFNFLLKKDIFRAGLELQCTSCNLKSWLSLKDVDNNWQCDFCGNNNLTSVQLQHRGDWKFRKSGLFSKDNNQEGAIPVLLTLHLFANRLRSGLENSIFTYSMELSSNNIKAEADFILLNRTSMRREGAPEIGIAECKSAGGEITEQDIKNFKAIREILKKKGIKCFFIFSKTADEFRENEISMFKELAKVHIPIILLTNKELESLYDIYEAYEEKGLPRMYAPALSEMSSNSRRIYLS